MGTSSVHWPPGYFPQFIDQLGTFLSWFDRLGTFLTFLNWLTSWVPSSDYWPPGYFSKFIDQLGTFPSWFLHLSTFLWWLNSRVISLIRITSWVLFLSGLTSWVLYSMNCPGYFPHFPSGYGLQLGVSLGGTLCSMSCHFYDMSWKSWNLLTLIIWKCNDVTYTWYLHWGRQTQTKRTSCSASLTLKDNLKTCKASWSNSQLTIQLPEPKRDRPTESRHSNLP